MCDDNQKTTTETQACSGSAEALLLYSQHRETCEVVGCDDMADYYDEYGNALCEDCAELAIENEDGACWDDFERI